MYYDRTLEKLACLIKKRGALRWLFDYVKNNEELDFLIGKNNQKEWISVYRGLSRILTIAPCREQGKIKIDAADAYKRLSSNIKIDIYGKKEASDLTCNQLDALVESVRNDTKFIRYYQNRKEGYYQNILSRRYGIWGAPKDEFVIIDKEAVIGYENEEEKKKKYGPFHSQYKKLLSTVSAKNPKRFGSNLGKKPIGNEVDFSAIDKEGVLLIIEYKHGTNTSGIYLSPLQIGMYYDLFLDYRSKNKAGFDAAIISMLKQKQKIGLINPAWKMPKRIKGIIPTLIISEQNCKSVAERNFKDVLEIVQSRMTNLKKLKVFNYTTSEGLKSLAWI